jgi:hypothetical protein
MSDVPNPPTKEFALEQVRLAATALGKVQQRSDPDLEKLRVAAKTLYFCEMQAVQLGATASEVQEASEWEGITPR